ncbi:DUF1801 domain-containing protein [Candidatus Izemoplasma sp. B36]|uniref:DUF1801 domain-containing protein n=1 Tax=Candidatus Izemoplasma sp. B36 TaxID=3242468 RepID=UPI003557C0ED
MYELKTQPTKISSRNFLDSIVDIKRKNDALRLFDIISELTDEEPIMWGSNIIGYGNIEYSNSTNKKYKWFKFGFSPRKNYISLYLTAYSDYIYQKAEKMNLKHGKGCVYIKDIDKVNISDLKDMILYTLEGE